MKLIIPALIIIAILLAGCQELKNIKLPGIDNEVETSSGSITAYFVNPKTGGNVLSEYPFSPAIGVKSLGGYESEGQTCISGLDSNIFSGFSGCECTTFQQVKDDSGVFQPEDLTFGPYTIHITKDDRKEHIVSAVTRYLYGNEVKANICISKDIYENTGCSPSITSSTSGPLDITSIEQETIPISEDVVTLIFRIKATQEESGRFIPEEDMNGQCTPVNLEELPKVEARVKGFPTRTPVVCKDVEIEGKEVIIVCEAKDLNLIGPGGTSIFGDNYNPELTFEIRYFFETTSSSRFTVQ